MPTSQLHLIIRIEQGKIDIEAAVIDKSLCVPRCQPPNSYRLQERFWSLGFPILHSGNGGHSFKEAP